MWNECTKIAKCAKILIENKKLKFRLRNKFQLKILFTYSNDLYFCLKVRNYA